MFGDIGADQLAELVDGYLREFLGTGLRDVLFRAGRIDAVWGVTTHDARDVVIKAHRPPVDLAARGAAVTAQEVLVGARFPCPVPLSGPDAFRGFTLSAESYMNRGLPADAHLPAVRATIAEGLFRHIDLLRSVPSLASTAGRGPAWCRYENGPWPRPHDTIFDFSWTPDGFGWLDDLARAAADQTLGLRPDERVVGHADWYAGNLRFLDGQLVATFDWELTSDAEAVVAGLAAGGYTAGPGSAGAPPPPEEVAAFLADYDSLRSERFSGREQGAAAGAAAWVIAFNARCELALPDDLVGRRANLTAARELGASYARVRW